MSNIVLQSDYGLGNGTSNLYGVCKRVDPDLKIYDLSHAVPGFDIRRASENLAAVVPAWPAGTVFVSAVDPATGTEHLVCAAKTASGKSSPSLSNKNACTFLSYAVTKLPLPSLAVTVSPICRAERIISPPSFMIRII